MAREPSFLANQPPLPYSCHTSVQALPPGSIYRVIDLPATRGLLHVVQFPSSSAIVEFSAAHPSKSPAFTGGKATDGCTTRDALKYAREGHGPTLAAAEAVMSELSDLAETIESGRRRTRPVVAGGQVITADALMGLPLAFRRRVTERDTSAPLTIVFDGALSQGIDAQAAGRRATAVLALAHVLSAVRPVTLYVACSNGGSNRGIGPEDGGLTLFPIDTQPLDVARASFLIGHVASTRQLQFDVGDTLWRRGGNGLIPWGFRSAQRRDIPNPEHRSDTVAATIYALRTAVAMMHPGETLVLPPVFLNDPSLKDPIGWVRDMAHRYMHPEEYDTAA